jgi:hypothetical protein
MKMFVNDLILNAYVNTTEMFICEKILTTSVRSKKSRSLEDSIYGYISMSNCFPGFIVRWILNFLTGTPWTKVISQYTVCANNILTN